MLTLGRAAHAEHLRPDPGIVKSPPNAAAVLALRLRDLKANRAAIGHTLSATDPAVRSRRSRVGVARTHACGKASSACIPIDGYWRSTRPRVDEDKSSRWHSQNRGSNDVSERTAFLRRIAISLIAHAKQVVPPERSEWAEAMGRELEYIDRDLNALRWAIGCVMAGYIQRGVEKMNQHAFSFGAIIRKPSALFPMAMSVAALAIVLGYVARFGVVHESDENAVAHLWQLLMAGQLPVLAFFAIKWLPRAPKQTLFVLGLQVAAVLAAMAPVYFLHL